MAKNIVCIKSLKYIRTHGCESTQTGFIEKQQLHFQNRCSEGCQVWVHEMKKLTEF